MIDLTNLAGLEELGALDLALHWASRGVPVLPTNPDTKAPWIGRLWEKQATTDPATIRGWASKWAQGARVGIKTGLACGCGCEDGPDVLDFDVSEGKPGLEQLQTLVNADVLDGTRALRVQTPSGGAHWWFAGTTQHNKQNDDSVWGVDLRAHHGMVLAPGNPGYVVKGVPWEGLGKVDWEDVRACPGIKSKPGKEAKPAPVREPVRSLPVPRSSRLVAPARFENAEGEDSPLDWFCNNNDLGQLLAADGWQYAYTHAERDYYTRPGKHIKDGVSGNVWVNPDGRQTLVNFSSSVDLPTDRGLSAAQYVAYRDFQGDVRAFARHVRTTLMPRRERPQTTGPALPPANAQAVPGTPVGVPPTTATPGAELVPAGELPEAVQTFWWRRRELAEVWWKSQVGGVSPWAVLGAVLANVAGRVGPHVVLPPLGKVGSPASLNVLFAVSGNSGSGKGRSNQIAREFVGSPYPPQRKPGTGQGIAAMFTEQTKEGPVQSNDTVVLNVAEITQLGAHMSQQGATITSTLLEVYGAEELGEHYANKELRRPVREGAYRLALVAGVQPGNSHVLFDHAESGLPQRFVWCPAFWPQAVLPEGPLVPPAPGSELARWRAWPDVLPGSLDDRLQAEEQWSPSDAADAKPGKKPKEPEAEAVPVKEPLLVTYSPAVQREVDRDHRARLNAIKKRLLAGEDNPGDPDAHLLLTRIKVATLLALWLDHSTVVSDDVWDLARWVLWVSNDTRAKAQARLRSKAAEKAQSRAVAQVAAQAVVTEEAEKKHTAAYVRALDRLLTVVTSAGDWTSLRVVNQKLASKEKKTYKEAGVDLADVLGDLVLAGKLVVRETERSNNTVTEWKTK